MIWIGLGLLLVLTLFGVPAMVGLLQKQAKLREARAADRRAEEDKARQAARDAKAAAERIWRESPDRAGVGEYLRYRAVRTPLEHAANEAERLLGRRGAQVDHHQSRYGGKLPSAGYRLLVLIGLAFFLAVFSLGIALDFLIFRGLHPAGTMMLPLGLACLAVVGITVGSVVMLGAKRHDLLPDGISDYYRRVVMVGGALLAVGIALYLAAIAPNRSIPGGQLAVSQKQQVLYEDKHAVPPAGQDVITADQAAVTQAKASLARAEQVDRLSAGALAFIEIPLSEAAVLGGELLMLYLALSRRERARREHQRAQDAVQQADARFIAELTQILIRYGHDEASVRRIISRVNNMNSPASGPPPGISPAPPAAPPPAAPPPGGPAPPPPAAPPPGGPTPPPPVTVIPPGVPVPGGPATVVPPPVPGPPPVASAPIVSLPDTELDQTE